jgi:hypothetical protein
MFPTRAKFNTIISQVVTVATVERLEDVVGIVEEKHAFSVISSWRY